MNINKTLTNIINEISSFNQSLKNLEEIDSDEKYIERLLELISNFGNHPKLISLLMIRLQIAPIDYHFEFELLDKLGLECLINSDDTELLAEYYFYNEKVLQDSKNPLSQDLIDNKLKSQLNQLNEIIIDKKSPEF